MPIFEYECESCRARLETISRIGQEPGRHFDLDPAQPCTGYLVRVFSVPARAQFKGTGFYETDYKRKS